MLITVITAKTAEPIEIPIEGGGQTLVGPGNYVLDGSTYGRHLANTIERSVLSGDVAVALVYVAFFGSSRLR